MTMMMVMMMMMVVVMMMMVMVMRMMVMGKTEHVFWIFNCCWGNPSSTSHEHAPKQTP